MPWTRDEMVASAPARQQLTLKMIALLGSALMLGGCAAAVIPVVAGGVMARKQLKKDAPPAPVAAAEPTGTATVEPVPPAQPAPAPEIAAPTTPVPTPVATPPGDAGLTDENEAEGVEVEAAAPDPETPQLAVFDYPPAGSSADFARFARAQHIRRATEPLAFGMVLDEPVDLIAPRFLRCDDLPSAVMIDLDMKDGPDPAMANGTTPFSVEPELAPNLKRLRHAGIAILWVSALDGARREGLSEQLMMSGLDPDRVDDVLTIWSSDDRKELVRQRAARDHCILAVLGDRKSDAAEAYDYLKSPEAGHLLDTRWGAGWFLAPGPLHPPTAATKK